MPSMARMVSMEIGSATWSFGQCRPLPHTVLFVVWVCMESMESMSRLCRHPYLPYLPLLGYEHLGKRVADLGEYGPQPGADAPPLSRGKRGPFSQVCASGQRGKRNRNAATDGRASPSPRGTPWREARQGREAMPSPAEPGLKRSEGVRGEVRLPLTLSACCSRRAAPAPRPPAGASGTSGSCPSPSSESRLRTSSRRES